VRENWGFFIDGLSPLFVGCKFGGNPFPPLSLMQFLEGCAEDVC
jgi:hypothetical protein